MTTLFTNGRIYETGRGSRKGAVAVRAGKIVAVGDIAHVKGVAGPDAQEYNLAGGLLSPSFIDAHLHPMMGGVERVLCNLGPAESAEDCLKTIANYASSYPRLPWILGGGWRMDLFPGGLPTRQMLDFVVPDRPVLLGSADRHSAWVNTKALELAGLTNASLDPVDGRLERDSVGALSGVLHEGAMGLVRAVAPEPDSQMQYEGLLAAQEHCFSHGITGWQDALVRIANDGTDALDVYARALEVGSLKAKVTAALWWDRNRGPEQIADLMTRRSKAAKWDPQFRADSVKIALDGIMESYTASLTESYCDGCGHATQNSGINFIDRNELLKIVRQLDDAGFQAHFHALGDQAVRNALDALEGCVPGRDLRHHLAHVQVIQANDVERFSALSATANIQPLWAQNEPQMTELTIPFLPGNLASRQYPFGDLHRSGSSLAAGSDWPVSSIDPIEGVHVAVNRSAPDTAAFGKLLSEQALDLTTAWDAYTFGSARVNHRDTTCGSIRVGADADLVVLDRDPFGAPVEEIAEAQVRSTWVNGEPVWGTA